MPSKAHSIATHYRWTEAELLDMPIEVLDRLAFGVTSGDCIEISPKEITINYPGDLDNPRHCYAQGGNAWLHSVSLEEPVDITIDEQGRKNLSDGHHRYFAALLLGKSLKALVEVKANPVRALLAKQNRATYADSLDPGLGC